MSTEVKGYVLALLPPSEQSEIESGAKKVVMVVHAIFEGKYIIDSKKEKC